MNLVSFLLHVRRVGKGLGIFIKHFLLSFKSDAWWRIKTSQTHWKRSRENEIKSKKPQSWLPSHQQFWGDLTWCFNHILETILSFNEINLQKSHWVSSFFAPTWRERDSLKFHDRNRTLFPLQFHNRALFLPHRHQLCHFNSNLTSTSIATNFTTTEINFRNGKTKFDLSDFSWVEDFTH